MSCTNLIPDRYLSRMSKYSINNVHGDSVTAKIANGPSLVESHISALIDYSQQKFMNAANGVVGVDVKRITGDPKRKLLVFCTHFSLQCLVFDFDGSQSHLSKALCDYLAEDPEICFVGNPSLLQKVWGDYYYYKGMRVKWNNTVVDVGDLAARVLKKPALTGSNLAEIAREIGIRYDPGSPREIQVDPRNPSVFTEEMMKNAISDASAYYKIGCKLLISQP